MITEYDDTFSLGSLVSATGTFTTTNGGAATDPTTVKVSYKDPSGNLTTKTYVTDPEVDIIKDSAGVYHINIDADKAGLWWVRWWSTGTGQASFESEFVVRKLNAVA